MFFSAIFFFYCHCQTGLTDCRREVKLFKNGFELCMFLLGTKQAQIVTFRGLEATISTMSAIIDLENEPQGPSESPIATFRGIDIYSSQLDRVDIKSRADHRVPDCFQDISLAKIYATLPSDDARKVFMSSALMYSNFLTGGFKGIVSWIKRYNLLEKRVIFLPVMGSGHYSLAVIWGIDLLVERGDDAEARPCILLLDSLRSEMHHDPNEVAANIRTIVSEYLVYKDVGRKVDDSTLPHINLTCQQQTDGINCGPISVGYVDQLCSRLVHTCPTQRDFDDSFHTLLVSNWATIHPTKIRNEFLKWARAEQLKRDTAVPVESERIYCPGMFVYRSVGGSTKKGLRGVVQSVDRRYVTIRWDTGDLEPKARNFYYDHEANAEARDRVKLGVPAAAALSVHRMHGELTSDQGVKAVRHPASSTPSPTARL